MFTCRRPPTGANSGRLRVGNRPPAPTQAAYAWIKPKLTSFSPAVLFSHQVRWAGKPTRKRPELARASADVRVNGPRWQGSPHRCAKAASRAKGKEALDSRAPEPKGRRRFRVKGYRRHLTHDIWLLISATVSGSSRKSLSEPGKRRRRLERCACRWGSGDCLRIPSSRRLDCPRSSTP